MGDMITKKGIDVSHWQGIIDFEKVKKAGIDFVIIKAGGSDNGFYRDSKFLVNYKNACNAGLLCGAYYFVGKYCTSYAAGVADAERFLKLLKGKTFSYPLYIDIETTPIHKRQGATDAVIGFCQTMEKAGCYVGIYASDISGFKDRLILSKLFAFDKWVARYGSKPKYVSKYGMWQMSSKGQVDGIRGYVDIDECYYDYPKIITRKGLNNL